MKLFFNSFFVFLFLFCFPALCKEIVNTYTVKSSGIKIGILEWEIGIEKTKYTNKLNLKSEGFLSAIYSFRGEYFSEGFVEDEEFMPIKYYHSWKTKKIRKKMNLFFKNNSLLTLDQEPIEKENLRVDVFAIKQTKDPLSSFLQIIKGGEESLVVDGRRLYTMSARYGEGVSQTIVQIKDYFNLWADHKRSKFEKITYEKNSGDFLPSKIFIYFDGRVFKLEKN